MYFKKRRDSRINENRNNYFDGSNYLERDNPEELELRERISQNYPKALSDYLKEKLISDFYWKKIELFEMNGKYVLKNLKKINLLLL